MKKIKIIDLYASYLTGQILKECPSGQPLIQVLASIFDEYGHPNDGMTLEAITHLAALRLGIQLKPVDQRFELQDLLKELSYTIDDIDSCHTDELLHNELSPKFKCLLNGFNNEGELIIEEEKPKVLLQEKKKEKKKPREVTEILEDIETDQENHD